jgi:hypothetical protein
MLVEKSCWRTCEMMHLPKFPVPCDDGIMNLRRLIGRLLAVFVIVGLVAAPLVTPAAAKRLPVAEMSDMSAMSGDMPCCPGGQKNKRGLREVVWVDFTQIQP